MDETALRQAACTGAAEEEEKAMEADKAEDDEEGAGAERARRRLVLGRETDRCARDCKPTGDTNAALSGAAEATAVVAVAATAAAVPADA